MARADRLDAEGPPERTCIVTRTKGSPQDMIRFVVGPGATVVANIRRKLSGRGVRVLGRADLAAKAVKRQVFSCEFKTKVAASDDLTAQLESLVTMDCLQALSFANKAGQLVTGFTKAEKMIASGASGGLVHATGCGAVGMRKLQQSLRRRHGGDRPRPWIGLFRSGQLDLALGRSNVIHVAQVEGAASRGFLNRCRRLALYRSVSPDADGSDRPMGLGSTGGTAGRRAETARAGTQDR